MKKIIVSASILSIVGLALLVISGCGMTSKTMTDSTPAVKNTAVSSKVIATNKLTISLGKSSGGVATAKLRMMDTSEEGSTQTDIVADVPPLTTFQAQSTLQFNVTQLGVIEADGSIALSVAYNDLIGTGLQKIRVVAYMTTNGLVGQQVSSNTIPLQIEVVNGSGYADLSVVTSDLKAWLPESFGQAINDHLTLKLKGDFTHALNQQFKGTIVIALVRDDSYVFNESFSDGQLSRQWTMLQIDTDNVTYSESELGLDVSIVKTDHHNGMMLQSSYFSLPLNADISLSFYARGHVGGILALGTSSHEIGTQTDCVGIFSFETDDAPYFSVMNKFDPAQVFGNSNDYLNRWVEMRIEKRGDTFTTYVDNIERYTQHFAFNSLGSLFLRNTLHTWKYGDGSFVWGPITITNVQ